MNSRFRARMPGARAHCAIALAMLAWPLAAAAQGNVVKCIDPSGNVTYQDAPCEAGQAGRNVELPKAESREDSGTWEAAAREARVVKGMPKRWVLRARGSPQEIRPGSVRENATEVWRYPTAEGATLVGFAGPNVAWVRQDTMARDQPPGAATAPANAEPGVRGAHNRRFVIPGRFCEHVFTEIGPADRQEALAAAPAGAGTAAGIRYVYEPGAGDPQMRTVFTCVGGKVADVERTVVR